MNALRKPPIDPLEVLQDKYADMQPQSRGRAVVADLIKDLRTKQMQEARDKEAAFWRQLERGIGEAVENELAWEALAFEPMLGDAAFWKDAGLV